MGTDRTLYVHNVSGRPTSAARTIAIGGAPASLDPRTASVLILRLWKCCEHRSTSTKSLPETRLTTPSFRFKGVHLLSGVAVPANLVSVRQAMRPIMVGVLDQGDDVGESSELSSFLYWRKQRRGRVSPDSAQLVLHVVACPLNISLHRLTPIMAEPPPPPTGPASEPVIREKKTRSRSGCYTCRRRKVSLAFTATGVGKKADSWM